MVRRPWPRSVKHRLRGRGPGPPLAPQSRPRARSTPRRGPRLAPRSAPRAMVVYTPPRPEMHVLTAAIIFVLTYLVIGVQRFPKLHLGRPAGALLGAVAMVAFGVID